MYKNEFDNLLKQGKVFKNYLFYGQSIYLIEEYSTNLAKIHSQDDDFEKIYFEDYDFKEVKDKLAQSSLFSANNVILVKIDKKIPKKDLDSLVDTCSSNPSSVLIIACMGDADFKSMEDSFKKQNCASVRFFHPSDSEAVRFLEYQAKNLNLKYDVSALNHLYFMHKSDLSLCVNDLRKLAVLNENITSSLVNLHCFGMGNVNFEDFLYDLLTGKDIGEDLNLLLENGENEIYLLNQIVSFIQQLFMISSYARSLGEPNPKEILGFIPPKNVWEKKSRLAIGIKPEKFEEMLNYLLEVELLLKSSKINNHNLYLQSVLRNFTVFFR